jgi:hypothetical protein
MDLKVHEAVIQAKERTSGCTVHFVEEKVDSGQTVLQKTCTVTTDDTPDSLKAKVQALEGPCLVEAVRMFRLGRLGVSPFRVPSEPSEAKVPAVATPRPAGAAPRAGGEAKKHVFSRTAFCVAALAAVVVMLRKFRR